MRPVSRLPRPASTLRSCLTLLVAAGLAACVGESTGPADSGDTSQTGNQPPEVSIVSPDGTGVLNLSQNPDDPDMAPDWVSAP